MDPGVRRAAGLAVALWLAGAGAARAQQEGGAVDPGAALPSESQAGPLAAMESMVGTWTSGGEGFRTMLGYRWLIEGRILEAVNDVVDETGNTIARYRGAYAWDAGRGEIAYWLATGSGEVHRGRAWWEDGVLYHEATVSGGGIDAYASAVHPSEGRLEYFADYGGRSATPALLEGEPLVYAPAGKEAGS